MSAAARWVPTPHNFNVGHCATWSSRSLARSTPTPARAMPVSIITCTLARLPIMPAMRATSSAADLLHSIRCQSARIAYSIRGRRDEGVFHGLEDHQRDGKGGEGGGFVDGGDADRVDGGGLLTLAAGKIHQR